MVPFRLKNVGTTYQRVMMDVLHNIMGREVEDYVENLVVKSVTHEEDWNILHKMFERCRMYNLKMNLNKCVFRVSSGKFLGFYVHQQGINVDLDKTQAIISSPTPKSHKELKILSRRLSYIRRFIPSLSSLITSFTPLMEKGVKFEWTDDKAYKRIHHVISGLPFRIYLTHTFTSIAIGALLAQADAIGQE